VTSCPFREGDVPKWVVIVLPILSVLFLVLVPILSYRIYALKQNRILQPIPATKPTDPEIQLQIKTVPEQDPDHDDEISYIESEESSI
jgi:hypothetical protein